MLCKEIVQDINRISLQLNLEQAIDWINQVRERANLKDLSLSDFDTKDKLFEQIEPFRMRSRHLWTVLSQPPAESERVSHPQ